MIKSYIKIAIMNIRRNSTYSILNISGMAAGMASAILILLWVQDEWRMDRHFRKAREIFRVIENQHPAGGEAIPLGIAPGILSTALKEEFPEIVRASRYNAWPEAIKKGDEIIDEKLAVIDKDFLEMFDIEFIQGDKNSALDGPHDVIITEEMANKYFGPGFIPGRTLAVTGGSVFNVKGVVRSLPRNSIIRFDFLASFKLLKEAGLNSETWDGFRCPTFIELNKGSDSKLVGSKISGIVKRNLKNSNSEIFLQNIRNIHLFSAGKYREVIGTQGEIAYIRILGLIAVFILLIACINFMNLSTAQSARRAREIGVRKVAGAGRGMIISQFLGESLLIVLVAHVIAMILVELLLPGYNILTGKQLEINYQSIGMYAGLITIILFCAVLAGSYPAFYLSSLNPLDTMKGDLNKNRGNTKFRRILVIFQFSISVLLIICTLIIATQLKFLQKKNLGLTTANVCYFGFRFGIQGETLKNDLIKNPNIQSVTIANGLPCNFMNNESNFNWEGKNPEEVLIFYLFGVDADFASTFGLELKEGRFFTDEFSTDNNAVVINERAAKIIGFKDPVGKSISLKGTDQPIIGIIKDFNFQSLHMDIEPLIMRKSGGNYCIIRMKPENMTSTFNEIKETIKSYNLPYSINLRYLDEVYENLYSKERRMGKIVGYFSLLAILISCLGLIGLSSFTAERRTKEIGIRKINGSKSAEIFYLLIKEYVIPVILSICIACPIGFFVMQKWLQNFAYQIEEYWWIFLLAGLVGLLIAILTVSHQSFKAASTNPVESLRYE